MFEFRGIPWSAEVEAPLLHLPAARLAALAGAVQGGAAAVIAVMQDGVRVGLMVVSVCGDGTPDLAVEAGAGLSGIGIFPAALGWLRAEARRYGFAGVRVYAERPGMRRLAEAAGLVAVQTVYRRPA